MSYDIQLTVIKYNKKTYISHLSAMAMGEQLQNTSIIQFGPRSLIEIKPKDKHLIAAYPVYDMDSMLQSFVAPAKIVESYRVAKKDCFTFDGMTFIPLSKLQIKNKYNLRFSLPSIKIFGTYYILCNKQKDVNTRIVVIPE